MKPTAGSVVVLSAARFGLTLDERFNRLDRYCDELESIIAQHQATDEDVTGAIERSAAGLERIERRRAIVG